MRVLISYAGEGQIAIIEGLLDSLANNGIDVLAWNRFTHKCFSNNDEIFKKNISFFTSLRMFNPRILAILYRLSFFHYFLVKIGMKDVDILNFHFHDRLCDRLIPYLKRRNVKLMISLWGSDLYRISDKIRKKRQLIYPYVDLIHVESPGVKKDFIEKYDIDEKKVVSCNYGISLFEFIDRLRGEKVLLKNTLLPELAKDRIVVTCGYNARKGQQHSVIINQLKQLPLEYKRKLFIVFPLTYTAKSDSFLDEIDEALEKLDIPYCCFRNKLTECDLAKLRLISDVVINIQISDALSSSLVEYFYSGNVMLLGEWLPYQFLYKDYGISYIPIKVNNISDKIIKVMDNIKYEKEIASKNIDRISLMASWDSVSLKFVKIFNSLYMQ